MKNQKKLLWNAGKFVYQKGSDDPLLFLPLEDFFRSTTEELCYLVLLRGQQESIYPEKVKNTDIFFWIKRNSVEEISSLTEQLLRKNDNPSEFEIREYLEGNICRCTGYHNIVKSIQVAAKNLKINN